MKKILRFLTRPIVPTVPNAQHRRVAYLDISKAMRIVMTMWYHVNVAPMRMLSLFGMPQFFFISGIFLKPEQSPREFFTKKLRQLVLPLCIFFLISLAIEYFVYDMAHWHWEGYFTFSTVHNAPLWFLCSLTYVYIIAYLVEHYIRPLRWRIPVYLLLSFAGWLLVVLKIHLPLMLSQAFLAYPFMLMGFHLRHHLKSGRIFCPLTLIFIVVGTVWAFTRANTTNMHHLVFSPHYFPPMIKALAMLLGVLFIAYLLSMTRLKKALTYVGESTLLILGVHMFIIGPWRDANELHLWLTPQSDGWSTDMLWGLLIALAALLPALWLGKAVRHLFPWAFPKAAITPDKDFTEKICLDNQ